MSALEILNAALPGFTSGHTLICHPHGGMVDRTIADIPRPWFVIYPGGGSRNSFATADDAAHHLAAWLRAKATKAGEAS